MTDLQTPASTTASAAAADVTRSSRLANPDLVPTTPDQRTWGWFNYTTLWMGMIHNIVAWETASGLVAMGMSPWQALLCVVVANVVLIVAMIVNSKVGTRYGIPFPVIIRSSFGIVGANLPVIVRAVVAIFWFAVQGYAGSTALNAILPALVPGWKDLDQHQALGLGLGSALSLVAFWLLHMAVVSRGMREVKNFELWAGPLIIVGALALSGWAVHAAHGLGPVFDQSAHMSGSAFWAAFPTAVTALVGVWATLVLNISDFTRFARSDRDQRVGQLVGLPGTAILFALLSIVTTSGTVAVYGTAIANPVDLLQRFGNPVVLVVGALLLIVMTLSVNIAGNVVSAAYDLVNLFPRRLRFRSAGNLSMVLALFFAPWTWFDDAGKVFDVMNAVGGALGPVAGVMMADYYVVRRQQLDVAALYDESGAFRYTHGWNVRGVVAWLVGTAVALVGLVVPVLSGLYDYSWFLGLGVGFVLYVVLMGAPKTARTAVSAGEDA